MNPIVYVFINKGLGMTTGKVAAQAVHASMMSNIDSFEHELEEWRKAPHKTVIILEARDEAHIKNIEVYLNQRDIQSYPIIDEGVNEIDAHTITALSTGILDKDDEKVKLAMSTFKLYRDMIKFNVEVDR